MEQLTLNLAVIDPAQLATYKETAEMYGRGLEARKIPLENVYELSGFNHRYNFGDIRALADYLLAGGEVPPIEVNLLKDGKAIIIAGHRRTRAHRLLVSEGHAQFNVIQAFISKQSGEQERIIKSAASNNNKPFEPLELAELFKDLQVQFGMSNADIARATGHSFMTVSNQLRLAGITDQEKDLIRDGSVAATTVLDMIKKDMPPGARLDAVHEASGSGDKKGKLKVKDVEIMGDLKAKELDDKDTPESLIKGLLIHVKALDRIIGTDSRMSDITFKIDAELRVLKTLVTTKYKRIDAPIEHKDVPAGVKKIIPVDPLFLESANLILEHQQPTTSLLQRKLKIGYNRANLIMDQLELLNIIGPFQGSTQRDLLINDDEKLKQHLSQFNLETSEEPF